MDNFHRNNDIMEFTFKHAVSGEVKIVTLSESEIQDRLSDHLTSELTCDCGPVGETNVVECNCEDYICDFEIQERGLPIAKTRAISHGDYIHKSDVKNEDTFNRIVSAAREQHITCNWLWIDYQDANENGESPRIVAKMDLDTHYIDIEITPLSSRVRRTIDQWVSTGRSDMEIAVDAVIRDALDRVDTHPCDESNDDVKFSGLSDEFKALFKARNASEVEFQIKS
jgi:hypothetical protein